MITLSIRFKDPSTVGRIILGLQPTYSVFVKKDAQKFELLKFSKDLGKIYGGEQISQLNDEKLNADRRLRDAVISSGLIQMGGVIGQIPEEAALYKPKVGGYKAMTLKQFYRDIFKNIVVFDTNSFLYHIITNHALPNTKQIKHSLVFVPPLVIWELENLAKVELSDAGNKVKNLGKRKMRLAKSAFRDVRVLQEVCKECILTPRNISLTDFANIKHALSSRGECDRIIRNYISEIKEKGKYKKEFLFVTSDSFNALAAEAEGIKTCFISFPEPQKTYDTSLCPFSIKHRLGSILRELAEDFGEIIVESSIGDITVRGDWAGKLPHEWVSGSINLEIENRKAFSAHLKKLKIEVTNKMF